ncbi:MAG: RHS repeat-associated core domain-containing protein [Pseudomonas lundensis]|uniref:RHS repeat-associated core domain-containing protein n=1 Tax=Pseudomonas lundensis TaxID=86185 RepID=UPI00069AA7CC|nr:RHS repeat-associated core domain-containing protein [Pseudomonas lundensis]NLU01456.1 RHS repeat-associated core domain-containing protein [Pseudomonas lundensis]NNA28383.1 RHS repeat-associated core domain-containing protein [Pseudomonas lundensis]NNA37812.1 RHS repeat-associated core domain-containing protein [Pseudomonas lundensis]OZY50910.1 RHS repeat-associated core domain-containing protein [Pseudomonas lundensis]
MATFQYHYDPLDRLIQTAGIQRFYNQSRITTEIEGTQRYSVFQQDGRLLAQQRRDRTKDECHLLGTDLQQSILHLVSADKRHVMAYNPYGHRPVENGLISVLGFNGERADPVTGHYLLGNGYRAFNPVLMRFNSPDSWSPFERGGVNSYGYVGGDPVNRIDPSGHFFWAALRGVTNMMWGHKNALLGRHIKSISNVKKIMADLDMYAYGQFTKKGERKIVLDAHSFFENSKLVLGSKKNPVDPERLVNLARENGVKFELYDSVKLMICHSAERNFAQQVANLTGLKTKGFRGTVAASHLHALIPNMEINKIYQPTVEMAVYRNTGMLKMIPELRRNYDPVTFFPTRQAKHIDIRRA